MSAPFRFLRPAITASLVGALLLWSVRAEGASMSIYYDNGGSSYAHKTFSAGTSANSLAGTGLLGTASDAGDRWVLEITGGNLNGRITTTSAIDICLNGNTVVLSNTKSGNAIRGGNGVRVMGPGVLHIDQWSSSTTVSSGKTVTFSLGAVVGINNLDGGTAVSGTGIRIIGAAVHVNASEGYAFHSESDGFDISASIVSAVSTKECVCLRSRGPLSVSASSVHFLSTASTAIRSGSDIYMGGESVRVSSSVFCAAGSEHGIKFHENAALLSFDNVIGVVLGRKCGVADARTLLVDGGATKLVIAGNAKAEHSAGEVDAVSLLEDDASSGQAVWMPGSRSYFELDAGSVKLFAPRNVGLSVATNVVAGGSLRVESSPSYGDFQDFFTAAGIVSAAETVAGGLSFGKDILFADIDLTQALSSVCTAADALFGTDGSKASVGLSQRNLFVLGGSVFVSSGGTGISMGKNDSSYGFRNEALYYQSAGRVAIESEGLALADLGAIKGRTSREEDESLFLLTGGRLSAKGRLDGVLTCGGFLMEGGTLEAAATGGFAAGTSSSAPGLRGYALGANNGFAIDGGSFVATAGDLRTAPNTSSEHGWASVHPCDLDVSGAPEDEPVAVSDVVPSWYGTNDLYPVEGILRLWLPAGAGGLRYGDASYVANGNGSVQAGDNRFLPDRTLLSIVIEGPDEIASGTTASYVCRAVYDDGTQISVRPSWSVAAGREAASISAGGLLSALEIEASAQATVRACFGDMVRDKTVTIRGSGRISGDWYVDAATGSDENDGRSRTTAKATIQAAIDEAEDGDAIHVNDGVYEPISTVDSLRFPDGKRVEIVSENGPEATMIDGSLTWGRGATNRCAFLGARDARTGEPAGRQAVLDGFTLRKGIAVSALGAGAYGGTLRNCAIVDNRSDAAGGGAAFATLESCVISGNRSEWHAGGTYACDLFDCTVSDNSAAGNGGGTAAGRMFRCIVRGNSSGDGGGGHWGGDAEDCLIAGNDSAVCGGGATGGNLRRCTIVGNRTDGEGGGVNESTLHSCIVWGNEADVSGDNWTTSDGFYNDTAPLLPGTGNICIDPLFRDAPDGDYRLATGSPCADAGFGPTDADNVDLAGSRRWQGVRIDMGAYELANSVTPRFLPGEIWVDAVRGDDLRSGSNREQALATIGSAVQRAADGSTIRVMPGTYGAFSLDGRNLRVTSEEGAERTVVDGRGLSRCVWMGPDSRSELSGFTICNGNAQNDGGGVWGGTLEDCVVRDNVAANAGGGVCAATLIRCRVENNEATEGGGCAFAESMIDCLVAGNESEYNGGGVLNYGGVVLNCTIAGNRSRSGRGGGIASAIAANSIVWGNSAPEDPDIFGCDEWRICSPVVTPDCEGITDDPLFVDAVGGDYRLSKDSPCIDAGDPVRGADETDLAGDPRVSGVSVDLGCYEREIIPPYTVVFNANGGSGTMPAQDIDAGATARLSANRFVKNGFAFLGWARSATSPVAYSDGASVKDLAAPGSIATLFARWAAKNYAVAFNANGGTGTMSAQTISRDATTKLKANAFKRLGWIFLGWAKTKTGAVAYKNGAAVKNLAVAGKSVTVYAKWAKKSYKVKFVANGGKGKMAVQKMTYGKARKLTANKFKREGYVFKGWATSKSNARKGKVKYKNKKSVKNLVTTGKTVKLYAVWKKK